LRPVGFFALGVVVALAAPTLAQESGWHYSPLPGEGDRAAMGCTYGSTPEKHACLVVRCEDDFTVGLHIQTSRPEGDVGKWHIEFDKGDPRVDVTTVADGSPYDARIEGDVGPLIEALKNGAVVYLDPASGPPLERAISLSGSLYVINQALYFCAPKVPETPEAVEP
jgi:hypothetical protein